MIRLIIIVIILSYCCLSVYTATGVYDNGIVLSSVKDTELKLIRIALAVDEHSVKDLFILISSILGSAKVPEDVRFHIVACGKVLDDSTKLINTIKLNLQSCFSVFSINNFDIVPFSLPTNSGFAKQLALSGDHGDAGKKKSHWYSPTGADMVRFFLASIFPSVPRLLYVDNDVVITCCLEEIWTTDLKDKIVGIVLDDLKWATVTQFQRHYNASHPLVISNIKRQEQDLSKPLTSTEFAAALPRYPNDGVLLMDVQKYNKNNILQILDTIAEANSRGEYIVGIGTQQFTVLSMHDKWIEISPRANLRHFPDMARGYLMWYYYHGFLHFAGQHKPRLICQWNGKDNEHRLNTYTPWATAVKRLWLSCPNFHINQKSSSAHQCHDHIPDAYTLHDFISLIEKVILKNNDPSVFVLRIGGISTNLKLQGAIPVKAPNEVLYNGTYLKPQEEQHLTNRNFGAIQTKEKDAVPFPGYNMNVNSYSIAKKAIDTITLLDQLVLYGSRWSVKFHDRDEQSIIKTKASLSAAGFVPSDAPKVGNKAKFPARSLVMHHINLCDESQFTNDKMVEDMKDPSASRGSSDASYSPHCTSALEEIKAHGNKHWDAIGIVIDYQPTPQFPKSSSLGALKYIDFTFLRPKFIVVRIGEPLEQWLPNAQEMEKWKGKKKTIWDDAREAMKILSRNGYMAYIDQEGYCQTGVCIWGIRFNILELD